MLLCYVFVLLMNEVDKEIKFTFWCVFKAAHHHLVFMSYSTLIKKRNALAIPDLLDFSRPILTALRVEDESCIHLMLTKLCLVTKSCNFIYAMPRCRDFVRFFFGTNLRGLCFRNNKKLIFTYPPKKRIINHIITLR